MGHQPPEASVLVVEDDPGMADLLHQALTEAGFAVVVARDGRAGLQQVRLGTFRLVVLDRLLPGLDGVEVCRQIRSEAHPVLILMVTALGGLGDRVGGLDAGADDYLAKPFGIEELLARCRALLRREAHARPASLVAGDLRLDPLTRKAWRSGVELGLSPREFALLELLLRRPGIVITRRTILASVWGEEASVQPNVVDVSIGYLRRKIDRPFGLAEIETVHGVGYRLRVSRKS